VLTTPINAVATTQEMVPIPQDVLQSPLDELNDLTVENSKVSSDPLVHTFAHQIWHFSNELIRKLQKWSSLDESLIRELKSGTSTSFLELEIVDQLAELLLNEFGQSLAERDIAWTNRIRECCQQVRALLNELMDRPPDARLKTALDSPASPARDSRSP